ncbi:ABC transporter ATP-binding protein [Natrarchaeobius sp. A-rgal3]|uniref:ABC transporter ATP-binding protein n=1 Tax=Natrarchaeobius versutus TaxID=1679078 RepID=UPI00350EF704
METNQNRSRDPAEREPTHAVSYEGVSKQFGDGDETVVALEDIDLDINSQEFVSIVGPSGCGKSTLLNIVAGLHEPTTGSVEFAGTDITETDLTGEIGFIFQSPVLLDWRTVEKNVLLPAEIMLKNGDIGEDMDYYRERTEELISLVGLDGFGDSYPRELSGGMQQRVSICQSLVYNPSILLMDEPFGALDALTKDKLNIELLDIWRRTEKTILFVTHDLDEAVFLSDRVVVLSERPGRIQDVIDVDLERPRNEETKQTEQYHELVNDVYQYFR